jgi:hypothetical protein
MASPMKLNYQAPIRQAMLCLVQAGVQVPSEAVMNFPRLALSVGAVEAGRSVSPRSRSSPALTEVRAMKLKWGKLGKRRHRQCTGCPASKTKKKSGRARKQSISRSKIWLAYAPSVNHNYTDLALRLRLTRTHDRYQELPYYSFEECLAATLLVRFNRTPPPCKQGKPSSPAPKGERSRPRKGKPRHAC